MADALARLLYSVILVSLIGICVGEIRRVWFDHTLYIQPFKYNKDGQDASAAGLAFADLIRAQQAALLSLLRPGPNDPMQIFARPLDIRGVGIGKLDTSDLSEVKVEAQGVNITGVLSALRRAVSRPNEITGSISELGEDHYVYASWSGAPQSIRGNADLTDRDTGRSRDLPSAAFAVSCRIVYAQLAPANAQISDLTAEGFCSFARALSAFDSFLELREGEAATSARAAPLKRARLALAPLMSGNSQFPYVWKLAAYVSIEESALNPNEKARSSELDEAEGRLERYASMLATLKIDDPAAQDRLEFLRARKRQLAAATLAPNQRIAAPGRSLGLVGDVSAASACCVVKDSAGGEYLLASDLAWSGAAKIGDGIISPAAVDGGNPSRPIGNIAKIVPRAGRSGGFLLIRLHDPAQWTNVLPNGRPMVKTAGMPSIGEKLMVAGRTSRFVGGTVSSVAATVKISLSASQLSIDDAFTMQGISKPGDSGGAVVDDHAQLVGMVYAGSPATTVVLPLRAVLEENHLNLADPR